jgi:biotin carboxyl carrier protein
VELEVGREGAAAHRVEVVRDHGGATLWIDGRALRGALARCGDRTEVTIGDRTEPVWIVADHDAVHIHAFGRSWRLDVVDPVERRRAAAAQADLAAAPMPGTVVAVAVSPGDAVIEGQQLVVIESMKMQSEIVAWRDGTVEQVFLAVGQTFDRGAGLVALAPEEG